MAIRLRGYDPADLAAIHSINEAACPAVGTATFDELGHIARESLIAVVADEPDTATIAGFCLVLAPGADYGSMNYMWFSERYENFVYLDRIAIGPAFQRAGLGQQMYAEVERLVEVRCPEATHFTLEVNLRPRNEQSLAFHARLGFAEVDQRDTDYGTLVSLMAKPLR